MNGTAPGTVGVFLQLAFGRFRDFDVIRFLFFNETHTAILAQRMNPQQYHLAEIWVWPKYGRNMGLKTFSPRPLQLEWIGLLRSTACSAAPIQPHHGLRNNFNIMKSGKTSYLIASTWRSALSFTVFLTLALCSIFSSGCSPSGQDATRPSADSIAPPDTRPPEAIPSPQNTDPVPESTYKAWQDRRSYYALLEIVDAHIDPCGGYEYPCGNTGNSRATKKDVLRLLGDSIDKGYPHAGPDMWVYSSDRQVPLGSYLIISFDKQGMVEQTQWVSE